MPPLETLQRSVARAVLGKPHFGLSHILSASRADPYRRLRIYQNNTRASLTATLEAVFPVTVRLVDRRFFRYAAAAFVSASPPTEPRLVRYGARFPDFLRTFDGLEDMPFVAETARLEWAIACALDSAAPAPLSLSALGHPSDAAASRILLQPSLRMIVSPWPVLAIWSSHQQGRSPDESGPWRRGWEQLALWRAGESIRFARLNRAEFAFRHALSRGDGLERAVSRALTHEPMFDVLAALVSLFRDGLVAELAPSATAPQTRGELR